MNIVARRLGFLIALLLALAQSRLRFAHASLIRAEPADGAMLAQAPATLRLTFNEPVSPLVMRLVGPSGEVDLAADRSGERHGHADTAAAVARQHVLSWRVISADGHPVGGSLLFSVGAPSAQQIPPAAEGDAAVQAALWAAKVVLYLGLFVGIGGAFFGTWIAERGNDGATRWLMPIMLRGLGRNGALGRIAGTRCARPSAR